MKNIAYNAQHTVIKKTIVKYSMIVDKNPQ